MSGMMPAMMVNAPTRPRNMRRITTIFPAELSFMVSPRVKPTVENADIHSKISRPISFWFSVIERAITPKPINTTDSITTANARLTLDDGNSRPNISTRNLSFPNPMILENAKANVVVFIPPAVDAGEPPTHIRKYINTMLPAVTSANANVLKPAVLGLTDAKKDEIKACPSVIPKSKLFRSNK